MAELLSEEGLVSANPTYKPTHRKRSMDEAWTRAVKRPELTLRAGLEGGDGHSFLVLDFDTPPSFRFRLVRGGKLQWKDANCQP